MAAREQRAAEAALQQAMAEAAARAAADAAAASRRASSGGASLGPASGNLVTVSCPGGGSITVDSSIAGNLRSMLDAAAADGNNMCGGGYRDPSAQIALRRANCGTSDYAIYEAPSSSCSPPTAPPGTSNHEQGLAIDFTCNGGGTLEPVEPVLHLAQGQRRRLRLLQPAERALALEQRRHLTGPAIACQPDGPPRALTRVYARGPREHEAAASRTASAPSPRSATRSPTG